MNNKFALACSLAVVCLVVFGMVANSSSNVNKYDRTPVLRFSPTGRMTVRSPPAMMMRQTSMRHGRYAAYASAVDKDVGLVPDKSEPDKDLVPADGGLLDSIFNKWLCKASPTRSIVIDRQREMNEERAAKGGKPIWDSLLEQKDE
mmetsp:Transcript_25876/g.62332  ORF Transcript_25876/g.62332 Transcript_25876/m.62332 type:complete len:146 (-) Transcript_25876:236-673(-)|eukprot:CAMPEP_0114520312 /NCGR_PEP_ID=MMETSP0109-20121206/19499_1 /TAXON_ID=29199 /ORGANISM="Chlorarachnion reptans, Strain CCCM449" /LENGTH=145 /DNA_ID=CAMNT_0001701169 /DNA_START=210 /DNA_END=647 /DNA_ORIENTATION=+